MKLHLKKRHLPRGLRVWFLPFLICIAGFKGQQQNSGQVYIHYMADPKVQKLKLYWRDDAKNKLKSIGNLKAFVESKGETLLFAMNAGMYKEDNTPLGLYIENHRQMARLNTAEANGNFYLKPNGVFYITDKGIALICTTPEFKPGRDIRYATQSGPMLLINDRIHPAFQKGSKNLNIRNGVGILPGNKVVFAMSKEPVNFYDFAMYFKRLGCKQALYLDGFVSRMYLPGQKWVQTDGNFGVMIGITQNAK